MNDVHGPRDRRLQAVLARTQRDGRLPSVVAGVVTDGALAWSGAVGEVAGEPIDTQYRIGSITKTLTAVLVLRARDDGLLSLDDALGEHVAEAPYADRTLRALLSHSAGLPGEPAGPWWERSQGGDFAALVAANAHVPPLGASGAEHVYSNLAYGLLGEVVARVRGEAWWSLVEHHILEPLGMTRTTYHPGAPQADGYSVSHLLNTLTPEPASDTGAMAPAGQLWSTLTDLTAYAGFLLDGHPEVLSADTLREAAVEVLPESGYGLGFRRLAGGSGLLVGHTGTMPGFMAGLFVDRERRQACFALANGTLGLGTPGLVRGLLDAFNEPEPEIVEPWVPSSDVPHDVRALVGVWHWGETAFEFSWRENELAVVELRDGDAWEEFHREGDDWVGTDGSVLEVVRGDGGSVAHLVCTTYLFTRVPYDPSAPIPGDPA